MKEKFLFLILFSMMTVFLGAQEYDCLEVDVEMAVNSALENQTSVKESAIKLNQAERKYQHSWNNVLPSVTASVSGSENGAISQFSADTASLTTNVNASLSLNLGLAAKIKALKASYESGKKDYEDTLRQIEYEVRKSFYSILYLQGQMESSKENLDSYQAQYEQTKIKKEKGLVPEIDLLTSQVNYESAKIDYKNTEKSYVNALLEFLNETGIVPEANQRVSLKGSLDDYQELLDYQFDDSKIDEVVENNSEIRSIKDSLEQTKLTKKQLVASSYLPSLTLSADVKPYSYSYALDSALSTTANSWSASVGLSLSLDNLLPGSSASDTIKDYSDSISTLELQLEEKRLEIRTSLFEMLNEIEIAKDTLENCKLNVDLAKKTYDMALVAYKNGTKDLSSLQSIQNSYTNAVLQLRNQQLNLINNILELKNTIGD